jgi:YHS domain-containing protein
MLSMIFRVLGLFFLAWLFQRLMGYFLGASKSRRAKENSAAPSSHMVKDPVCGMYMDSRLAVRLDGKNEEFYFCSEECKQKYLNNTTASGTAGSAAAP